MQRDNDYIRELLFELESQNDYLLLHPQTLGASLASRKKSYHLQLLCDAGYLTQLTDSGFRMTSQGHDLIESIRDEGIWQTTKKKVAETGGNATFEIIQSLALGLLKTKISKHTGIEL